MRHSPSIRSSPGGSDRTASTARSATGPGQESNSASSNPQVDGWARVTTCSTSPRPTSASSHRTCATNSGTAANGSAPGSARPTLALRCSTLMPGMRRSETEGFGVSLRSTMLSERPEEPMPRPLVLFVDVDDTLVRSFGSKRIAMSAVVERVRALHAEGAVLYCWSSGGADYARASAEEFGLGDCFAGYLPKPDVFVDDVRIEAWRNTVQLHPNEVAHRSLDDLRALVHAPR